MADESLNLQINANASELEASLSAIISGLAGVSTAATEAGATVATGMNVAGGATEKLAVEAEYAGAAMVHTAEEAEALTERLEGLSTQAGIASGALKGIGIKSEALAQVGELSEGLAGLGKAVPAILGVTVALAGVAAVADFLKEASDDAAEMEQQYETLGAAVEAQGKSWAENEDAVKEWIESESLASGILASDLVPALNNLVSAGHSVADSQKILAVAEELSIGKHIAVGDAVRLLISAEEGRAQGLIKLDSNVKAINDSHGKMSALLQQLHKDFGNQIQDQQGVAATQARMRAEMESVSEVIGNILLPYLKAMSVTLLGIVVIADDAAKAVSTGFMSMQGAINDAAKAAEHFANAMADLAHMNISGAQKEFAQAGSSVAGAWNDAGVAVGNFAKAAGDLQAAQNFKYDYQVGNDAVYAAMQEHKEHTKDLNLDVDPNLGKAEKGHKPKKEKAEKPAYDAENIPLEDTSYHPADGSSAAQKTLDAAIKSSDDSLNKYRADVQDATTVQDELTAKQALAAAEAKNLADVHKLLNDAVYNETQAQAKLSAQMTSDQTGLQTAKLAYNAFAEQMKATGNHSEAAKAHLAALHQAVQIAQQAVERSTKAYKDNSSELTKNSQALDENNKKRADAVNASAELARKIDEEKTKVRQSEQDEEATYNLSTAAQIKYYQNRITALGAVTDANFDQWKEYYDKVAELEKKAYTDSEDAQKKLIKDQEEARKKALEEAQKDFSDFLDDVLVKHESFAKSFKSLWDNIEKQFLNNVTGMITGANGLGGIFGGLSGGSASGASPSGGGLGSILGSLFSGLTGASTGVSPNSVTAIANTQSPAAAASQGVGSTVDSNSAALANLSKASAPTSVTIQGAVASAALGGTLGGTVASLTGGNSTFGSLGGVLGGVIGAATHANPLIGAGIDVVSGLIGSLFGPHETAAETPDISDPQYHQIMDNYNGNGGLVQSQYSTAAGGTSMASAIEQWANSEKGQSGLSTAVQNAVNQVIGLEKGDPNADLTNASLHQGILTLQDGSTIPYADLKSIISTYQSSGGASASSGVYSLTRSMPNFQASILNSIGTFMNGQYAASGGTVTAPGNRVTGPVVNITVQGNLVGQDGMSQLAQTVSKQIIRDNFNNSSNVLASY